MREATGALLHPFACKHAPPEPARRFGQPHRAQSRAALLASLRPETCADRLALGIELSQCPSGVCQATPRFRFVDDRAAESQPPRPPSASSNSGRRYRHVQQRVPSDSARERVILVLDQVPHAEAD